jgi:hypothetical protein
LTFGLGIIILQGVSRRKSLAGVNIMTYTTMYLPMRMIRQYFNWLCRIPYVPELGFTIITTTCQVILFIGIKVKISHQLTMSIFNCPNLSEIIEIKDLIQDFTSSSNFDSKQPNI